MAAVMSGILSAMAPAQESSAPPMVFLEKAYFSPATPSGKNLMFEGNPTAHYFVLNQLNNAEWQKGNTRGLRRWRLAIPISEMFVVRMTDTTSQPVLTPSYHIRPLYVQGIRIWREQPWSTKYWLLGLAAGATHYSNGQHGCTYAAQTRDPVTLLCTPPAGSLPAGKPANTLDGDFSTTYVPLTVNLRRARLIEKFSSMKWQWTLGGDFQYHLFSGLPGAMNPEQAAEYGRHQWTMNAELECRPRRESGVWRVATDFTQRFAGGVAKPLNNGSLQISRIWDRAERFGFFGRIHWGFDSYNIRFQDRRTYWSVGAMWDLGRLDSLASDFAPPTVVEDEAVDGCLTAFWRRKAA